MTLRIRALGPLQVDIDDQPLALGGAKQALVLGLLAAHAHTVVAVTTIIDALWGDEPNDRAASTVQVYISNLRKLLDGTGTGRGHALIVTQRPGYKLMTANDELDIDHFARLVAMARAAAADRDDAAAVDHYRTAESLWRGQAFADLADFDAMRAGALRLDNQRVEARAARLDLELDLGRHTAVLGELQALVASHPLDERLRAQLMLTLYRAGRQADALGVYQAGRNLLLDELGIDPGAELRALEHRILDQDPTLDRRSDAASPASSRSSGDDAATQIRSHVGQVTAEVIVGDRVHFVVKAVTTLGRRADRDVVVDDVDASRAHAEIRHHDGRYVLVDVGSTNGTVVDGRRVGEHSLGDDDEFTIGSTVIRFRRVD